MASWAWSWLAACLVIVSACSPPQPRANPPARSAALALCEDNGGSWDQAATTCTRTLVNASHAQVELSAKYPGDLLDDPAAGPPLKDFVTKFFTTRGKPDGQLTQSGSAELTFKTYEHAPGIKSIVFTTYWYFGGAHPDDEINTFTFDLANDKQLSLADLFCAGIDPLTALPPLARPYVERVVTQGVDISRFDPKAADSYADDYRAWYLDGPDLALVMPAAREGPAPAGTWQPRIPLLALHSVLRGRECGA